MKTTSELQQDAESGAERCAGDYAVDHHWRSTHEHRRRTGGRRTRRQRRPHRPTTVATRRRRDIRTDALRARPEERNTHGRANTRDDHCPTAAANRRSGSGQGQVAKTHHDDDTHLTPGPSTPRPPAAARQYQRRRRDALLRTAITTSATRTTTSVGIEPATANTSTASPPRSRRTTWRGKVFGVQQERCLDHNMIDTRSATTNDGTMHTIPTRAERSRRHRYCRRPSRRQLELG